MKCTLTGLLRKAQHRSTRPARFDREITLDALVANHLIFGSRLKSVIETAREQVAELIGAHPLDVIFTSCATESNNAAIAAALKAEPRQAPHRHVPGGTFLRAELLHGAGKGNRQHHPGATRHPSSSEEGSFSELPS